MKKFVALVAVVAIVAFAAPAFAANPFMDVPMDHWAYDAVSQLAARGIVTGYPDGAFKGEWKATRYEMASITARALAYVDMNKASKQDLEMLKKLVVEFKDELDALGVKVEELDSRVAVLEDHLGKWAFDGHLRWTSRWTGKDDTYLSTGAANGGGKTDFSLDRFRWNVTVYADELATFHARIENEALIRAYADIILPWEGATLTVGLFNIDWGHYAMDFLGWNMNDSPVMDANVNGMQLVKTWGMGDFTVFVSHQETATAAVGQAPGVAGSTQPLNNDDAYLWGARARFNVGEDFDFGLYYVAFEPRNDAAGTLAGHSTWWGDAGFRFTPNIELRGTYYSQKMDDPAFAAAPYDDSPNAWRAYVDVKQEALGFTSLWVEYAQYDQGFFFQNNPYGWNLPAFVFANMATAVGGGLAGGNQYLVGDMSVFNVLAMQKWNDKWGTYFRWAKFDVDPSVAGTFGSAGFDVTDWTFAVNYWYTPNVVFELGYDAYDIDVVGGAPIWWDNDDMIWFRTTVSF